MLILWSGGCDSTLLLWELHRRFGHEKLIRTLSISHPQISDGGKVDRKARDKIEKIAKRDGIEFERIEVSISQVGGQGKGEHGNQGPLWLSMAGLYLGDDENLYVGYIAGDDIWHYRYWYVDAFNSLQVVRSKKGGLEFPLEWYTKGKVLTELKKIPGLLPLCVYCELSSKSGKICGKCKSCNTHSMWLREISR